MVYSRALCWGYDVDASWPLPISGVDDCLIQLDLQEMSMLCHGDTKNVAVEAIHTETARIVNQQELLTRLGNRIRLIRKNADISQERLADSTQMSRHSMSKIENGKINVSLDTVRRIADALQITLAELMPDYPADK